VRLEAGFLFAAIGAIVYTWDAAALIQQVRTGTCAVHALCVVPITARAVRTADCACAWTGEWWQQRGVSWQQRVRAACRWRSAVAGALAADVAAYVVTVAVMCERMHTSGSAAAGMPAQVSPPLSPALSPRMARR
jgi:hypothetical protein